MYKAIFSQVFRNQNKKQQLCRIENNLYIQIFIVQILILLRKTKIIRYKFLYEIFTQIRILIA